MFIINAPYALDSGLPGTKTICIFFTFPLLASYLPLDKATQGNKNNNTNYGSSVLNAVSNIEHKKPFFPFCSDIQRFFCGGAIYLSFIGEISDF
jgi:hypothetical protein